jgi:hypothetical protein
VTHPIAALPRFALVLWLFFFFFFFFFFLIQGLAGSPVLASNYCAQVILLPQPPE